MTISRNNFVTFEVAKIININDYLYNAPNQVVENKRINKVSSYGFNNYSVD